MWALEEPCASAPTAQGPTTCRAFTARQRAPARCAAKQRSPPITRPARGGARTPATHLAGHWIVDLSGSTPSAPYQWVPFDLASLLWLPMQPNKAIGSSMTSASLIDVSMPSADPVALNLLSYVLSPTRDLIAYAGSTADITIRDLDATSPPISVPLDYISSGTSLRWSPDGKFLATPAGITSQLRMMRIDGGSPSAAISVYNSNGTVNSLYWPPVFP